MDGTITERRGHAHLANAIGNGTNLFRQEQGFTGPYWRCRSCDAHWWHGANDRQAIHRHRPRDCWRRIRRNISTPEFRAWARSNYPQADLRALHFGREKFRHWWRQLGGFEAWCQYKGYDPAHADADARFAAMPLGAAGRSHTISAYDHYLNGGKRGLVRYPANFAQAAMLATPAAFGPGVFTVAEDVPDIQINCASIPCPDWEEVQLNLRPL